MDIRCERCRAEYRFKDDAIGPAGLTVRCSKCGHVFKVRRPVAPAAAVRVPEAGWTLRKKRTGDVYAVSDLAQLQRWVAERRAIRDDEASVGGGAWRRLADIPELGAAFTVAQASKRSAGASDAATPGGARREIAHTTSVFPGPGRPPAPMQTEIAYRVPETHGAERSEPAWAQAPTRADPGRGPTTNPLFAPEEEARPSFDREPAFAEPEPTLREVAGDPGRGALPLTGSAPLNPEPPPPLSALIDERPPPGRASARPRKRSPVARVIGILALLITFVALAGVAIALMKPEWLDPLFANLDVGLTKKTPVAPPEPPVPGTSPETSAGSSGQGAPAGPARPADQTTRTPSTPVPGTGGPGTSGTAEAAAPSGPGPAHEVKPPSGLEAPAAAVPPSGSPASPTAAPGTGTTTVPGTGTSSAPRGSPAEAQGVVAPTPVPGTAVQGAVAPTPVPGTAAPAPAPARAPAARPTAVAESTAGAAPENPVPGTESGPTPKPVPGTANGSANGTTHRAAPGSGPPASAAAATPVPGTESASPGATAPDPAHATPPPGSSSESAAEAASALKAVAPAPPPKPAKPAPPKLTGVAAQLAQARALRARGSSEAALDVYDQILGKDPQNADALAGRGLAYFDLGRTSKAEEAFKAALASDEKNGEALLGLAETYRYGSRREDALAYYEKYLEAHPRGPGASIARANIQALKE